MLPLHDKPKPFTDPLPQDVTISEADAVMLFFTGLRNESIQAELKRVAASSEHPDLVDEPRMGELIDQLIDACRPDNSGLVGDEAGLRAIRLLPQEFLMVVRATEYCDRPTARQIAPNLFPLFRVYVKQRAGEEVPSFGSDDRRVLNQVRDVIFDGSSSVIIESVLEADYFGDKLSLAIEGVQKACGNMHNPLRKEGYDIATLAPSDLRTIYDIIGERLPEVDGLSRSDIDALMVRIG